MINMSKMNTLKHMAVGVLQWPEGEEARIESNLFEVDGETFEALRFCKNRTGRHNRVHLVVREPEFVSLFQEAVKNGVFGQETLDRVRAVLAGESDPFLDVIGIGTDGKLAENIDEELYRRGA